VPGFQAQLRLIALKIAEQNAGLSLTDVETGDRL
jgi:hypothetical protein